MNHLITTKCHWSQNNDNKQAPGRGGWATQRTQDTIQLNLWHCGINGIPNNVPICNFQGLVLSETSSCQGLIILIVYSQDVFIMFFHLNGGTSNHCFISKPKNINALKQLSNNEWSEYKEFSSGHKKYPVWWELVITHHETNDPLTRVWPLANTYKTNRCHHFSIACLREDTKMTRYAR